jgi:chromosome partitioning protein
LIAVRSRLFDTGLCSSSKPLSCASRSRSGAVSPVMIHARVDFATSMTDGRTAAELDPTSKSAGEVAELWAYLQSRLTEGAKHATSRRSHAA